jgi:hypothetical protein
VRSAKIGFYYKPLINEQRNMPKHINPKKQSPETTLPSQSAPIPSPDSMPAPQEGHVGKDKDNAEPGSGAH